MKTMKLTLTQIANHEVTRALRVLRNHVPEIEIIKLLIAERLKALTHAGRALVFALVATLWVASEGSSGSLKVDILSLSFSVPVAYVTFAISCALFLGLTNAFSYFQLSEFTRIAVNRLFKFDNASALTLLFDGSSAWSLGQNRQFRFLEPSKAHTWLGVPTIILAASPFVILILFVYARVLLAILTMLNSPIDAPFVSVLAVVSVLILIYPIVWIVLQFVPFTFGKNVSFIRWIFLNRIYRRMGRWHPRSQFWIEEGKKR